LHDGGPPLCGSARVRLDRRHHVGAAADARWHLGNLASFAAWMVLLPDTQQAVVRLINADTELPFNEATAVTSRLPIGVVNLLRGQPVPQRPSLREACPPLHAAAAFTVIGAALPAAWAARTRRSLWSVSMAPTATAVGLARQVMGSSAAILSAFAPSFARVLAAMGTLSCLAVALRAWAWARRAFARKGQQPP
jgi:hypothetical protein